MSPTKDDVDDLVVAIAEHPMMDDVGGLEFEEVTAIAAHPMKDETGVLERE